MFKQGNQFYLEIQIEDENNNLLDINGVEKVQFVIDDLVKNYDGSNLEVSYDDENKCFKIWLTEEETFNFKKTIDIDVRILYKEGTDGKKTINGSRINGVYFYDSLKKIELDNGEQTPTPSINLSEYFSNEVVSERLEIPDNVIIEINIKDIFKQIPDIHITGNGKTASGLFREFYNLKKIGKITNDEVTDTSNMFSNCESLTSIDLSNFNTSNVTNMGNMFYFCKSLTSLDLSNFETSNVTDMQNMFVFCSSLTDLDLSGFNTSKVVNMDSMFSRCDSLTNLDISNFDTSNVTNMNDMFYNCKSLTNLDVSNFNTSKVTTMYGMFSDCSSLTSLDISNFNTSNVTSMVVMFYNCTSLTNLNISNFDFTNVTSYESMFEGIPSDCYILVKDATAKEWITSKFTNLTNVHYIGE